MNVAGGVVSGLHPRRWRYGGWVLRHPPPALADHPTEDRRENRTEYGAVTMIFSGDSCWRENPTNRNADFIADQTRTIRPTRTGQTSFAPLPPLRLQRLHEILHRAVKHPGLLIQLKHQPADAARPLRQRPVGLRDAMKGMADLRGQG